MKTLCFTGHRPEKIGGYEDNPLRDWVRDKLADAIYAAFHKGFHQFICGGALGADWHAAEEVLDLQANYREAKLTLALPFDGYYDKWPVRTIELFEENIVAKADKIIFVCEPGYAPWKMQRRNEWMVDQSSAVIAVWNGSEGGTANCVKYAQKQERPIYRIDPLTKIVGWMK